MKTGGGIQTDRGITEALRRSGRRAVCPAMVE